MIMFRSLIDTAKIYPLIWRRAGLFLLVFFASVAGMDLINQSLQQSSTFNQQAMLFEAFYYLLDLALDSFLFLFIPALMFSLKEDSPVTAALQLIWRNLQAVIIEFIRVIASVLRWSLLLLVPGVYKQLRFYFVPYVVLFNPDYQAGEVDALQTSNSTVKGRTWLLLVIFIIDLALTAFADGYNQWDVARKQTSLYVLQLILHAGYKVFLYSFLFTLYARWSGLTESRVSHVNRNI